jgi:hypothetical protein
MAAKPQAGCLLINTNSHVGMQYRDKMLDYARQRVIEALKIPHRAVLATSGPAGVQAMEFPCEAVELELYLLVPQTSDHLFNLEHVSSVTVWTTQWELKGKAQIISPITTDLELNILREPGAKWSMVVRVRPCKLQILKEDGWGSLETIDINSR